MKKLLELDSVPVMRNIIIEFAAKQYKNNAVALEILTSSTFVLVKFVKYNARAKVEVKRYGVFDLLWRLAQENTSAIRCVNNCHCDTCFSHHANQVIDEFGVEFFSITFDLEKYFNSPTMSDIIFENLKTLTRFHAHLPIVLARCPKLMEAFPATYQVENIPVHTVTGGYTDEAILHFLQFLYSDNLMFTADEIVEFRKTNGSDRTCCLHLIIYA